MPKQSHEGVTIYDVARLAGVAASTVSRTFTPEEDALVLRPDLTARQVAQLLGRTAASVARRRKRLRA